YDLNQSSKMSLNIVDLNGRSVFNKTLINGQIGKNHFEISTRDFNSGVYIVNFFIDNKPFSKRIIVR
ncbi:MAG: T9SS type A sorting domain-containing protein, partial [Crocinitomicaceae bacterium]